MNWIFWALLIVGIILILWPFFAILEAAVSAVLWIIGGLLLIGAIIWAIVMLSRGGATAGTERM